MTTSPKIHGRSVPVFMDELGEFEVDRGKRVIVGGGVDEGGASGEEGDNERPNVFEAGLKAEKSFGADEGAVGVSPTIEGGDQLGDNGFDRGPEGGGKDEK